MSIKKLIIFITFYLFTSISSYAADTYFIDFQKVLNISKPGAEAQIKLKKKFESESKKFIKLEKDIKKEESSIISQKKTISADAYKDKVQVLRKKVSKLQKDKRNSFSSIAKSRKKARVSLLTAVNPIIKKYMEENKIRLILNKKSVVMGDTTLEITDQIIAILNKELPSLKVN